MRGHYVRTERNVVAAIVPLIAHAGEEIFYLKVFVVRNGEPFKVQIDPASLLLGWVKVDSNKNPIGSTGLAVTHDVGVIDMVEMKRTVALERRIVATNLI